MDGTKRAIRQEMRRRRRALAHAECRAADDAVAALCAALPEFRAAPVVLAYVATDNEVPTDALQRAARAAGKRVYLPRLENDTAMIFAEYRPEAGLSNGPHGIPQPLGDPIEVADLVAAIAFVPLLAWHESGARVGRGGGHYDRAWAGAVRPACLVGLGYDFQRCPSLPQDPWDLRLDYVVSDTGVVRCWNGDTPSPPRKEDAQRHGVSVDCVGRPRAGSRADLAGGHTAPAPGSRTSPGHTRNRAAHPDRSTH